MFSKTYSATLIGTEGEIIEVETGLLPGLHSFQIVGLPHKSVKEAKERISLAIHRSQAKSPLKFNKKIIINLAPADIPKEGSQFDLAIALSFLSASGQIKKLPSSAVFIGELGLNGEVKKIFGALPIVLSAQSLNFKEIYLPSENLKEVSFVEGIKIFPVKFIRKIILTYERKYSVKVASKGQLTLSKTLGEKLSISKGDKVILELRNRGRFSYQGERSIIDKVGLGRAKLVLDANIFLNVIFKENEF